MVENDVHSHEMNTPHISGLIKVVLFNMEKVKFRDKEHSVIIKIAAILDLYELKINLQT